VNADLQHAREETVNVPTGADMITAERSRQITVEGWTAEHDDGHPGQPLIRAAIVYANSARAAPRFAVAWDALWPWDWKWYKPSADPIRNLVKAGALIAAEIDRLNRKAIGPACTCIIEDDTVHTLRATS